MFERSTAARDLSGNEVDFGAKPALLMAIARENPTSSHINRRSDGGTPLDDSPDG
jgi:hypothetical protein